MKTNKFMTVLAAPFMMFMLSGPGHADNTVPLSPATTGSLCKDGTTSATTGRGACSRHGGQQKAAKAGPVSEALPAATLTPAAPAGMSNSAASKAPAASPAPATVKTPNAVADSSEPMGATAKCKDGTYSKSQHHAGSCSHHGGVAAWLTAK